jgi:hypothetical protein
MVSTPCPGPDAGLAEEDSVPENSDDRSAAIAGVDLFAPLRARSKRLDRIQGWKFACRQLVQVGLKQEIIDVISSMGLASYPRRMICFKITKSHSLALLL